MDRIKMTIPELHHGKKIREFLKDQMKLSSRLIKRSAMDGRIHVNGSRVRLDYILREGDEIDVLLEADEVQHIDPEDIPIEVIFEDASMLVLSKDPGTGRASHEELPVRDTCQRCDPPFQVEG